MFGIAALQDRLGATMGVPLECEHVNPDNGDTIQHTTTGLAYYRPSINTAMFTDGQTHWSPSNNELMLWRNASVTPPQPTAAEATYLRTTTPLQARIDALQIRLMAVRQQAESGQLDSIDVADLGALVGAAARGRPHQANVRSDPHPDRHAARRALAAKVGANLTARARLIDRGCALVAEVHAASAQCLVRRLTGPAGGRARL